MTDDKNRSALIFWGGWEDHEPEACAGIVYDMLCTAGFATRLEPGTSVLDEPGLEDFDLIVPIMTMSTIEKSQLEALTAAVRGGTGLGGFHGGMADAFRGATEYQFMCGGQWVAHPGDIIDYTVRVSQSDHPLVKGIGDFDYRSEQYFLHVDPGIDVLATTTFDGTHAPQTRGTVMPVVWTHQYGAGRVFYSALGHHAAEFDVPQMHEILRRGLIWAARTPT